MFEGQAVELAHHFVSKLHGFLSSAHFAKVRARDVQTADVVQVRRAHALQQVLADVSGDALAFAGVVEHAGEVGGVGEGQVAGSSAFFKVILTDSTIVDVRDSVGRSQKVFLVTNAVDAVVEVEAGVGGSGWAGGGGRGWGSGGGGRGDSWAASTVHLKPTKRYLHVHVLAR